MDNNLYELSKVFTGEKAIKEEIDKTYNKLMNHYKDIVKLGFEIEKFPVKEQNSLLIEIIKLKNSNEEFLCTKTPEKKFPNRRIIDNLRKDDMDLDKEKLIDFFIEKGNIGNFFEPNLSTFKETLIIDYENKEMIKQSIRYSEKSNRKSYEDPYKTILDYAENVRIELDRLERMGLKNLKQEMLVTDLIEESYTYLFLQSIIYLIVKNPCLEKGQRLKYLLYLDKALKKAYYNENSKCNLKYENIFNSFAVYLFKIRKRNQMINYVDIITLLEKEMEEHQDLFKDVQEQFKCNQRLTEDIKTKKELMNIVLEGKQEKVERFNEKADKCNQVIEILRHIAGRDLYGEHLQHFKVVYREIFLSKVKSNDKNANTIVRDMVKEDNPALFSQIKDSLFLREKISRGFFREDGFIEEYKIKNRIQRQLYTILLRIYGELDLKSQSQSIKILFETISKEMLTILGEIDEALT